MRPLSRISCLLLALALPVWADSTDSPAADSSGSDSGAAADSSSTTPAGDDSAATTDGESEEDWSSEDEDWSDDESAGEDEEWSDEGEWEEGDEGDTEDWSEEDGDDSGWIKDGNPWIDDDGWVHIWLERDGSEPWLIYTMTGGIGEDTDDGSGDDAGGDEPAEIDPVIYYTTGIGGDSEKLSPRERREARQEAIADGVQVVFEFHDADENGSLSAVEFAPFANGRPKAFDRADRNRDGRLSLAEFAGKKHPGRPTPIDKNLLEYAACQSTFNTLDFQPKDGFLTFGEYTAVLRPSGPGVLERIFAESDANGDGLVSLIEYCNRPVNPAGME